ncbi:hypothetical protein C1637_09140 [Chryseobacterium lactis]|uniref:Uncharacterized protein n=1 Tax=Chryseobacterium lactis TaxID=1241981 RepID=A0A3G6RCB2_CHRLC|nr:hypothetical protein [Chryseobacterium lactis]AZA82310.1 hypothetical protein EG342_10565 [Chryseobacterium lactis]AZB02692.1 hypothetical protein EG341_01425 [Chryseobacterium lactis]PNW14016.1 hypothetical protein C1637_09140 [Chryseobacterium lactis]
MKKSYILLLLIVAQIVCAQVGIGKTTINSSAVLDVSESTNKGVLLPRVDIVDILNNTTPVNNPAQGLIVYNKGNSISPGLYLWKNNRWTQLADGYNLVSYMMLQRTTDYTILGNSANGTFKNFTDASFTVVSNDIGATYNAASGGITLPGNSGYLVNMCLNIRTALESTTGGIGGTAVQLHQYLVKLVDPVTGTQYGKTISINAQSIASNKTHTLNMSFSFVTTSATPITLVPALAHDAGGTYQLGSGGTAPNNGEIIITNTKVDIQRSALNQ